jgi:hypothetical protein
MNKIVSHVALSLFFLGFTTSSVLSQPARSQAPVQRVGHSVVQLPVQQHRYRGPIKASAELPRIVHPPRITVPVTRPLLPGYRPVSRAKQIQAYRCKLGR